MIKNVKNVKNVKMSIVVDDSIVVADSISNRAYWFAGDLDNLFRVEITFYFDNCPEVPRNTFTFIISIFEKEEKFISEVQAMSVESLELIQIGLHRYDKGFPSRKKFRAFAPVPYFRMNLVSFIESMDELVQNPTITTLRKGLFERIVVEQGENSLLYMFQHNLDIHGYIIGVMDRLMFLYQSVTNDQTPFLVRTPNDKWKGDWRYNSDESIVQRIKNIVPYHSDSRNEYSDHMNTVIREYASKPRPHSHAVIFAYCMQKWCESAIASYYYDDEFYMKIRKDGESRFILYYVCEIVIRIESIMLWLLQKTKESDLAEKVKVSSTSLDP